MSTDLAALLEQLRSEPASLPLVTVDSGRISGAKLTLADFATARQPGEAYSGWLLYAGFGAESHSVSQDLGSREGSYWHGIYHRMEPDDGNAKYWFGQVGNHPIADELAGQSRAAGWNPGRNWDHARFVDFVSAARSSSKEQDRKLAQDIQWIEWRLLFEYCVKELS